MTIHTYTDAAAFLGKKTDRPLPGRATRIQRRDDATIAIRYQATDVITYHADNGITLQSGGWLTVTTKARINEYTCTRVYTDKGVWYVMSRTADGSPFWDIPRDRRLLYYDGMVVTADGNPTEPRYPTATDTQLQRRLDRLVRTYIKGFAAHVASGQLKNPSNGDCWGCLMQDANAPTVTQGTHCREHRPTMHGRTEVLGYDHYLTHFEEPYYVPSLLLNAIRARGYQNPAVIWHIMTNGADGRVAADILRAYFKNLKPALLAELKRTEPEASA